jgi:hypothetical protein
MEFSIGKIVTGEKVGDHYFYTGNVTPQEPSQSKKGTIFWLIELSAPDPRIPKIISHRLKKYYEQKEDGIWGFEQALKIVNRGLAKQIQDKNTSWVTHLNAILGLAQDNTVHLAATGEVAAYLFRSNKISNILDVEESPPPHQTFISVISGEVEALDKMFLATSEFTSYMTIETLADYLREPTEKAIATIAQYFRNKNIRSINALTLDFSKQNLGVDTIYLDQRPETTQEKTFKVLLAIKKYVFAGIQFSVQKIGQFEYRILRDYLEKKNREKVDGKINEKEKKSPLISGALRIEAGNRVTQIKNFVIDEKRTSFLKKNQKYIFIGLAAVLLIIFGLTLFYHHGPSSDSSATATANLTQATTLYNNAITAETNHPQDAYNALTQANPLATGAENNTATATSATALAQKIQTELNKITSTTVVSNATANVGDFSTQGDVSTNRIFILNNKLATFDTKSNQFFSLDPNSKQINSLFTFVQQSGNVTDATTFQSASNNYFLIKSTQNKFYTYSLSANQLTQATQASSFTWPTDSTKLLSYLDKVYLLEANQLERSSFTSSGFSSLSVAAKSSNQIKSCAIDGDIYFLTQAGDIEKYTGGSQDNFSLTKPFFLTNTSDFNSIYTNSNVSYLFLYEKSANRIILFDKTGAFQKQFVLPSSWGDVSDMIANSNNQLFVLANNKVYSISY